MVRNRSIRRKGLKNQKHIITIFLICLTFLIGTGYAAFSTNIILNTKGNIKIKTDYYVSSSGSDINGNGTINKPYATIQRAYDVAPEKANIYIVDDINLTSTIILNSNKNITLTSNNINNNIKSIVRDSSLVNYMINQSSGTLTIKNIIFDGNNIEAESSIIYVGGTLNMDENSSLINNINTLSYGGMYVDGTVIINDGKISNNESKKNGGGIGLASKDSILIVNGGEVSENKASWDGGGIFSNGTIIINNGKIINNTCGGGNGGGGILFWNPGQLEINGGEISGNKATNNGAMGGGIYAGNTFVLNAGVIKSNSSKTNGGIYNLNTSKYTNNMGIVCENIPTNSYETHTICPQS